MLFQFADRSRELGPHRVSPPFNCRLDHDTLLSNRNFSTSSGQLPTAIDPELAVAIPCSNTQNAELAKL